MCLPHFIGDYIRMQLPSGGLANDKVLHKVTLLIFTKPYGPGFRPSWFLLTPSPPYWATSFPRLFSLIQVRAKVLGTRLLTGLVVLEELTTVVTWTDGGRPALSIGGIVQFGKFHHGMTLVRQFSSVSRDKCCSSVPPMPSNPAPV